MNIREYNKTDNNEIFNLFYNTVHSINTKDYLEEQVNVWAKKDIDIDCWCEKFINSYTIIAEEDNKIVGFSNIDNDGYLDMLYIHKDYQHKNIASELLNIIEKYSKNNNICQIITYSSKTAKDFFLKKYFDLVENNIVIRDNVELENYLMKKEIKIG